MLLFLFDIHVFFCFQEIKYFKQVCGDEARVEPVQKKGEYERNVWRRKRVEKISLFLKEALS